MAPAGRKGPARLIAALVIGLVLISATAQASNSGFARLTAKPQALAKLASAKPRAVAKLAAAKPSVVAKLASNHKGPSTHRAASGPPSAATIKAIVVIGKLRYCNRWYHNNSSSWLAMPIWRLCVTRSIHPPPVKRPTEPPPADTTPPQTTINAFPPASTESRSATFSFSSSEAGSSFQCKLDSGSWANCDSPQFYSGLSVAVHTLQVRATDGAGNVDASPATRSWTIEALPPPPPPPPPSSCAAGATNATTAAAVRSAVSAGKSVCVTANVGDVDFSDLGNRSGVVVSTSNGSMGQLEIDSTTGLTIRSARFRSVTMRGANGTTITDSTIGGTASNRTYDQLIFMPDRSDNVTISDNDIGWTLADDSGNTGYGCRCYGETNNLKFIGNKVHDIAADGFQGSNGTNVRIDRNEIGPVGANPGSDEHSDTIQIVSNDPGMRITNNWLHDQGYFNGQSVGNAGNIYIHGGSTGSLLFENNLLTHSQGRSDFCGLGTGGNSRSNFTVRRNTWSDNGLTFTGFPGFSWYCNSGSGNTIERNIAVDPDGGFSQAGSLSGVNYNNNLWGKPSLVTLDAQGNCTSANCNPSGAEAIGYRKPSGVGW